MLKKTIALLLLFISPVASLLADPPESETGNPYQIVDCVTHGILQIIKANREQFDTNPQPFYRDLDNLLEDVVDFTFIARNVMGQYSTTANPEQLQRFRDAFKQELIETYSRGLMTYGDQEIKLISQEQDLTGKRRLTVRQEIRNKENAYPLDYSFGLNRDGEWKVTNLVINGINLGKTFRNQFMQRAAKSQGNLDVVIDNWSAPSSDTIQASETLNGSTGS